MVPMIFGALDVRRRELLAPADAADTVWSGNNWSRQALWQSSFLRTSKRPVDMALSIMGLFGVSLDPRRYRSGGRISATIALAQEYLRMVADRGRAPRPTAFVVPRASGDDHRSTTPVFRGEEGRCS